MLSTISEDHIRPEQDVFSELNQLKKELEMARKHYHAVIEATAQINWSATPEGVLLEDSPSWTAFTGQTSEEWLAGDAWKVIHPDDVARVMQNWVTVNTHKKTFELRYRLRHISGEYRWVEMRGVPVKDDFGNVEYWVGFTDDISAKVILEEKLAQSEMQFRTISESVPSLIFLTDANAKVLYLNQPWYEYTGYTPEQALGNDAIFSIREDYQMPVYQSWEDCKKKDLPWEMEFPLKRKDGEYRWFIGRSRPIKNDDGEVILFAGVLSEIHEQKQTMEELVSEKELREKFVTTLTHDLRNALAFGLTSAQLLERTKVEESKPRYLSNIMKSFHRVDHMVLDLLDANRIQAGHSFPLKTPERFELSALLKSIAEEANEIGGPKVVVTDCSAIEGFWSREDIRRLLENLINNAKKYGLANREITLSACPKDSQISITVHNWGDAIPADEMDRMFTFLSRSQGAIRSGVKGWGIGLTLVKAIAEAHKGSVSVSSSTEAGTTFTVILPVKSVD